MTREIWKLYHKARTGKLDVQRACQLAYCLTAMAKAHELSEMEARLRALENSGGRR